MEQEAVSEVPEGATQGAEARGRRDWWWAEASIWTERMVSALVNGVKGGKWFSLVDKVIRPATLNAAWRKVERNNGAAGVDCIVVADRRDGDAGGHSVRGWVLTTVAISDPPASRSDTRTVVWAHRPHAIRRADQR